MAVVDLHCMLHVAAFVCTVLAGVESSISGEIFGSEVSELSS